MTRKDSGKVTGTGVAPIVAELTRELSKRERLVLMLRYTEELTVTEIAAVLEIASVEVERILENVRERVRRRVSPTYQRPTLA